MRGNLSPDEEIKKYLFNELSEAEREKFEERLFEEDNYFYDVLELENDLVDRYALGSLEGDELERFERSLKHSPRRREKVANGLALQRRIAEERRAAALPSRTVAEEGHGASLRERLAAFFGPRPSKLRYAAAGLLILLTCGLVFLSVERFRMERELARLQDGRAAESQRREKELEEQVGAALAREEELRRQLESERGKSQVQDERVNSARAERERLQLELERLKRERGRAVTPPPTVASVSLLPAGRGAGGTEQVTVGKNTSRIALRLELEEGVGPAGAFSVEVNGRAVKKGLRAVQPPSGRPFVAVSLTPRDVAAGVNKIVLKDESDRLVGDYELRVGRR